MKNTLLITIVLFVITIVYRGIGRSDLIETDLTTKEATLTTIETVSDPYVIKYIDDISKLSLSSNLVNKKPAYELVEDCEFLVNGGFYSKEDNHIGLLVSDYGELSPYQSNDTFNGFLYFDDSNIPIISDVFPDRVRVALQTGPVIKLDSTYRTLRLSSDKNARRIIAATTNGDLSFIVIYRSDSKLFGPRLADLPSILKEIETKEGVIFDSAINLDGGAASAFYDGETKFSESKAIGSYFCLAK